MVAEDAWLGWMTTRNNSPVSIGNLIKSILLGQKLILSFFKINTEINLHMNKNEPPKKVIVITNLNFINSATLQ